MEGALVSGSVTSKAFLLWADTKRGTVSQARQEREPLLLGVQEVSLGLNSDPVTYWLCDLWLVTQLLCLSFLGGWKSDCLVSLRS
jgi:hypothetical protein